MNCPNCEGKLLEVRTEAGDSTGELQCVKCDLRFFTPTANERINLERGKQ